MKIKFDRHEFNLTENDVILYNGKCYQLLTQMIGVGWNKTYPILSIRKAEQLIKDGTLRECRKEIKHSTLELTYYKLASH